MGRLVRPVQGEMASCHTAQQIPQPHSTQWLKSMKQDMLHCTSAGVGLHQRYMTQCSMMYAHLQGVTSPLAGQMLFRSIMFGAFAQIKTWMATNKDGSTRPLTNADFYKVSIGHSQLYHKHSHNSYSNIHILHLHLLLGEMKGIWYASEQAGAATGLIAAFVEGPIDFYKSQIQVQIIRSRADPNYKRKPAHSKASVLRCLQFQS